MANSFGGWIVIGAERYFDDEFNITGFSQKNFNIKSLIPREIFFDFQTLEKEKILIVKIEPLKSRAKPLFFDGKFYRRVEGVNLISSKFSASIVAGDSRDDLPAMNFYLNPESLEDFYNTVIKLHSEYKNFSSEEFLCRSFIFSGKFLTFAGALMFGNIIKIRAVLDSSAEHAELEARNIWDAYKNILPRLVNKLSPGCSQAFQEIFVNSLLHADYNAGNFINISITSEPAKVSITNPGILRSETRNHRLKKIFELSGIFIKDRSLENVKKFMPQFRLEEDFLNFRVKAELDLEGNENAKNFVVL